jgi:hypothetical protein
VKLFSDARVGGLFCIENDSSWRLSRDRIVEGRVRVDSEKGVCCYPRDLKGASTAPGVENNIRRSAADKYLLSLMGSIVTRDRLSTPVPSQSTWYAPSSAPVSASASSSEANRLFIQWKRLDL